MYTCAIVVSGVPSISFRSSVVMLQSFYIVLGRSMEETDYNTVIDTDTFLNKLRQ